VSKPKKLTPVAFVVNIYHFKLNGQYFYFFGKINSVCYNQTLEIFYKNTFQSPLILYIA